MKTLKKTLCLVLAVVMVVGVLILPASAADAAAAAEDALATKYEEAIAVLGAIGVMQGDEGGFRAGDTITRREAAAVVARLKETDESVSIYPDTGIVFADCAGLTWGKSYIAYCQEKNIVGGDENGNFRPDDPVTGYELAKMLLVAVGFDPYAEGFNGSAAWAGNVYTAARKAGLNAGLDGLKWNEAIKRGEVAQMALNTLTYTTESGYVYTVYTVKAESGEIDEVLYSGPDYNQAMLFAQSEGAKIKSDPSTKGSLADTMYNGLRKIDSDGRDEFMRPTYRWVEGSDEKPDVVLDKAKTPDATFNGNFTGQTVKDLKLDKDDDVYYNGGTDKNVTLDTLYESNGQGKNGYEIEVYTADDTIVVREAYLAKVSKIKDDALTLTVYEVGKVIEESNSSNGVAIPVTKKDNEDIYNTLAPHADTYVAAYLKTGTIESTKADGILDVAALDAESVNITRRDIRTNSKDEQVSYLSTVTTDGNKTYGLNVEFIRIDADGKAGHKMPDVPSKGTIYTLNGTALGFVLASDSAAEPVTGYAYVLDYKSETQGNNQGWTDEHTDSKTDYYARLWTVDNKPLEAKVESDASTLKGKLVSYTIDSKGVYTLTKVTDEVAAGSAKELDIDKAVAEGKLDSTTNAKVVFDSATYFFVATGSGKDNVNDTVNVYKGIGEVPNLEGDEDTYVQFDKTEDGQRITVVLVKDSKQSGGSQEVSNSYFIVANKGATVTREQINDDTVIEYYLLNAVVSGQIMQVKVSKDLDKLSDLANNSVVILADSVTMENGVITKVTESTIKEGNVTKVSNDVIKAGEGDGTNYYVPNTVPVFEYDKDAGTITQITLDKVKDTKGYVVPNKSNTAITDLYVEKTK